MKTTYANIPNSVRRKVYARDGFRCALCDSTKYLQIHHVIPRGQGGSDFVENLITLCSVCHGQAHGINMYGHPDFDVEKVEQDCIEYVSDYYAGDWYPFK